MIRMAITLAATLVLAAPALAEDWDFILVNNTGKAIKAVEIAAAGSGTWQANKIDAELRKETGIRPNAKTTIHFDKGSGCKYDLKATFEDGASATWSGFNVCDNSYITISYANGAATFKSQ